MERKFKKNPNGERNRKNNNWRIGVDSLEQALEQFEPMVNKFANSYANGLLVKHNSLLDKEDLCQEGRKAIVVAYQMFNPKYEAQFSTYAYNMIRWAMLDYIKANRSHVKGGSYVVNHVLALESNGEEVTIENLIKRGVSRKTAIAGLETLRNAYRPDCYGVGCSKNFYDMESGTNESFETDQRVSTDSIEHVEGLRLQDLKSYLTDEECFIVKNFYGFNCDRMTMQEIGNQIGKSRKAVSYAINRALVKIRHIPGIEAYASCTQ